MTRSAPPSTATTSLVHATVWGLTRPARLEAMDDLLGWLKEHAEPKPGHDAVRYELAGLNVLFTPDYQIPMGEVVIAANRNAGARTGAWAWSAFPSPQDPATQETTDPGQARGSAR